MPPKTGHTEGSKTGLGGDIITLFPPDKYAPDPGVTLSYSSEAEVATLAVRVSEHHHIVLPSTPTYV